MVRDLTFRYPGGDHQVLAGLSFDIPSGAAAAIVGPSGSGKTTLLALMGELLRMQGGSIQAIDEDGAAWPLRHTATWVLQTVSLLPDRTAADNVAIGAYSDGATATQAQRRARECLAAVGLADHALDPARILSGGEAQRVAIARAIASHRSIILADEPTGQLDARTSATVIDAMTAGRGERTVVIVTHDPNVAQRCDLVLELRDGRIHQHVRGGGP